MLPALIEAMRDSDEAGLVALFSDEVYAARSPRSRTRGRPRSSVVQRILVYTRRSQLLADTPVSRLVELERVEVSRAGQHYRGRELPGDVRATDLVVEVPIRDAGRAALRTLLGWHLRGELVVPRESDGTYELDLAADSINIGRYMAPADEEELAAEAADEVPIEIPVDLIRAFNTRGSLRIGEAQLGRLVFEDITLDVNSANGRLRMRPISAQFLNGAYNGDVSIDASGDLTTLSVNERIENVNLGALAMAMFETDKVTGQINGTFRLTGRGNDIGEMQRNLNGDMSFVLSDGAWEGTDVWYQLRRARAMFKREEAPEPELPARTRFSEVSATGVVTDGVLVNEDFSADLPFMQLRGRGSVDIPAGTIDYSLTGRVLNSPELADAATAEEIEDLTSATIPLRISGLLAEPDIGVDVEALVRGRVEEEVRDVLLDRLLGGDEEEAAEGEEGEEGEEAEEEEDPEDILRNRLRDLIDN